MLDIKEFIGIGISGILTVLWFDIRNIRKERDEHKKKIKEQLKGYLEETRHSLLCENAALRFEAKLSEKLDDTKTVILAAIKRKK